MTVTGKPGCIAYGQIRTERPTEPVPETPWGNFIADVDDAMTGACRG